MNVSHLISGDQAQRLPLMSEHETTVGITNQLILDSAIEEEHQDMSISNREIQIPQRLPTESVFKDLIEQHLVFINNENIDSLLLQDTNVAENNSECMVLVSSLKNNVSFLCLVFQNSQGKK